MPGVKGKGGEENRSAYILPHKHITGPLEPVWGLSEADSLCTDRHIQLAREAVNLVQTRFFLKQTHNPGRPGAPTMNHNVPGLHLARDLCCISFPISPVPISHLIKT